MKLCHELIICGDAEVSIYNLAGAAPEMLWNWRAMDDPALPPELNSRFGATDECKPVGDDCILITASTGGVALVECPTRKAVFGAYVPNAHSATLLPGNRLAV